MQVCEYGQACEYTPIVVHLANAGAHYRRVGQARLFASFEGSAAAGHPDLVLHDGSHGAGLAGAIASDQADGFSLPYFQIDTVQCPTLSIRRVQIRKFQHVKIGRSSCRERVCPYVEISVVAVSLKKKK